MRRKRYGFSVSVLAASLLIAIAVFAPLIANDRPVLLKMDGAWSSPALFLSEVHRGLDFHRLHDTHDVTILWPPISYRPTSYDLDAVLLAPSTAHLLGTDGDGRDVAAQMVWGARTSLTVGLISVAIALFVGVFLGGFAGYFGGVVDLVISRLIEVMLCFPTFFLILALLAFVGPSIGNIIAVIGLTGWTGAARLVRGEMLHLKERPFVVATRALGGSHARILFRHLIPAALPPVLVSASFGIASAILFEATLSFLGFGVEPTVASWGTLLASAREFLDVAWWLTLAPGFAIFFTILSYNVLGETVRDALVKKS